jgi:hypothetical protein
VHRRLQYFLVSVGWVVKGRLGKECHALGSVLKVCAGITKQGLGRVEVGWGKGSVLGHFKEFRRGQKRRSNRRLGRDAKEGDRGRGKGCGIFQRREAEPDGGMRGVGQGRMARGGHAFPEVSPRPAIPDPSVP